MRSAIASNAVARFLVREHGDAEPRVRDHQHLRHVARQAAGVRQDLAAAVVAHAEAERVAVEVRAQRPPAPAARSPIGIGVTSVRQLARGGVAEQARAVGAAVRVASCTSIHFAMSSALELMPPAGLVLSLSNGAIGRTLPSTRRVRRRDVAAAAPRRSARTLLPVMPTFARMRDVDEVLPRLAADRLDHLAGDEIEDVVVGVGAAEAGRRAGCSAAAARSPCGRRSTAATTADRRRRARARCGARADRGRSSRA